MKDAGPRFRPENTSIDIRAVEPKQQTAGNTSIDYAPGSAAVAGSLPPAAGTQRRIRTRAIQSKVWMTDRI